MLFALQRRVLKNLKSFCKLHNTTIMHSAFCFLLSALCILDLSDLEVPVRAGKFTKSNFSPTKGRKNQIISTYSLRDQNLVKLVPISGIKIVLKPKSQQTKQTKKNRSKEKQTFCNFKKTHRTVHVSKATGLSVLQLGKREPRPRRVLLSQHSTEDDLRMN